MWRNLSAALLLVLVCVFGAGCSQRTINSANQDAQHNITTLDQKAKQVVANAKPEIKKLDVATPVATAITANPNLSGTHIRVDGQTNGVRLRGTVNTPQQKQLAGQVAKNNVKAGQTVDNELTVQAK